MLSLALLVARLLVFWDETGLDCRGQPLASPIGHYEVHAFVTDLVGWTIGPDGNPQPIYERSYLQWSDGPATSLDLTPGPDDVVWWDGMWGPAWRIQPPMVEAFTVDGIGSNSPCVP